LVDAGAWVLRLERPAVSRWVCRGLASSLAKEKRLTNATIRLMTLVRMMRVRQESGKLCGSLSSCSIWPP
jgi:hypothetical protein